MTTPEQEKWLAHLDDNNSIEIYPFDPAAPEKFEKIKRRIQKALGDNVNVAHRGATSLGISGQGELDIYIPVSEEKFDEFVGLAEKLFGKPGSVYPLERARFVSYIDNTKAEVFVINEESEGWKDSCRFEKHLKENPKALELYKKLKEEGRGLSTQAYYRKKTGFINDILSKIK